MKTYLDCIPCFLRQALEASRMATQDEEVHRKVLNAVLSILSDIPMQATPPEIAYLVHRQVKSITANPDPYREVKKRQNELAMKHEDTLSSQIAEFSDPVKAALMLSAAGNAIDLAPGHSTEHIYQRYMKITSQGFAWDDYELFCERIVRSTSLLFLGDNAGEIVWDKILVEELLDHFDLGIRYAVRGFPILNDATKQDALCVGMDKVAEVISNGFDAPGTLLGKCSEEFLKHYRDSDLILSKGQGNYESLSGENRPIFFLFNVKCPVVGQPLHCHIGDIVLKSHESVTGPYRERGVGS